MSNVQSTRPTGRPGHHEGEHRTKQGSTVDEESKSSQEARQSIVRIQLQKVQKFRGLFRSHDEPLLFSAGCCSSSCGVFPKVLCTPPVHQYLCAAAQRSDEFILDLDPLLISKELELPRTKMSRGSRSKCSVYSWRVCIDKIRR